MQIFIKPINKIEYIYSFFIFFLKYKIPNWSIFKFIDTLFYQLNVLSGKLIHFSNSLFLKTIYLILLFYKEPAGVIIWALCSNHTLLFTEHTWTFQAALKDLNNLAQELLSSGTFNVEQIVEKMENVNERFNNVQSLATAHHEKLKETFALFQFFQDLDDEESWIQWVSLTHNVHITKIVLW